MLGTFVRHLIVTTGITFAFIGLGVLIEFACRRITPNLPSPSSSNRIANCKYAAVLLVFQGTIQLIYGAILAMTLAPLSRPLFGSRAGIPFSLLVTFLYSVLGDFLYYWFHRWQHSSRWLWPMHELHHEDEHVNVTSAFKFHWMDSMADYTLQVLPTLFLPRPLVTIPILGLLRVVRVTFEHLAIPLHLGPFNRLITSPANHRIHHSKIPEHFNKNFAAVWPFWDVIFGTYHAPKDGEYLPTGLLSGKVNTSVKDALWGPLNV